MSAASAPAPELLPLKALARRLGVSVRTIRRWRRAGEFPEPVNGFWSWTTLVLWFAEAMAVMTADAHGEPSSTALLIRVAMRRAMGPERTSTGQRRPKADRSKVSAR